MSAKSTLDKFKYIVEDLDSAIYRLESIPIEDCTPRTVDIIKNAQYEIETAKKFISMVDMSDYGVNNVGENVRVRRPRIKIKK